MGNYIKTIPNIEKCTIFMIPQISMKSFKTYAPGSALYGSLVCGKIFFTGGVSLPVMKHLGLFAGIGGFELAARWMGWETIAWCEWNEFGQKVLRHHFPDAIGHGDITKTDFTPYANTIDILTGGFPCQPYSTAGKRLGKEDNRHLWPEMLRAIREISPRWVVGENVRGLTNWNGGMVFDEVQADLEAEGYQVLPFLLPACAVNAPHRRDRIWFIAYNNGQLRGTGREIKPIQQSRHGKSILQNSAERPITNTLSNGYGREAGFRQDPGEAAAFTNPERIGQSRQGRAINPMRTTEDGNWKTSWTYNDDRWPVESPVCGRNDGIPEELGKHILTAYGNAVVPQIPFEIYKAIEQYEKLQP